MGLQIGAIVPRKSIEFKELKGKVIAIDAFNVIYQFLSSIRQPDGTPLMTSEKKVTSHLSGLFYRNISLMAEGLKLVYVFDGEYHKLKELTHEIRGSTRYLAKKKYEIAKEEDNIEGMSMYSHSSVQLDNEKIEESKNLLKAMGVAVVESPGEGEMQCSQLVKEGLAYAVGSQDYDALVVGGTRLIQNLTLARKRKIGSSYIYISPEIIEYNNLLNILDIDSDQLISLAILVGTDFNPKGVKGIGPKKALNLVKEKKNPIDIFSEVEHRIDFDWKEIFEIFKNPNVKKGIKIEFPKIDFAGVKKILVGMEFSEERVERQLNKLRVVKSANAQQTLF